MTIALALMLCALAGLVTSTGFLVLIVAAAVRFRRRQKEELKLQAQFPAATLLKPVCGAEPELEANLASFFEQDYPNFEIIFGARDDKDPAIEVARRISARYPRVPVKFVFSGEPQWPNAKVWSLHHMYAAAANEYLVVSDSDVRVSPDYLREVVRPLLDPKIGLVTCVYRGGPARTIWSKLEALGMSVEMTAGVIVADLVEGMKFSLGPTMAMRKDSLDATGGFPALAYYCADDFVLGQEMDRLGRTVVLSTHVIEHLPYYHSFKDAVGHQVRWMRSTRFSRPAGHLGTVLTFAMPFGVLGLAAGMVSGHWAIGTGIFAWAALNRIVMSIAAGWSVVRDPYALRNAWLYPLRDLMGFCWWCASYFGSEIVWRDGRYQLQKQGRMVLINGGGAKDGASEPIAVDHLS
jgi:ceramide glucosyltransferase